MPLNKNTYFLGELIVYLLSIYLLIYLLFSSIPLYNLFGFTIYFTPSLFNLLAEFLNYKYIFYCLEAHFLIIEII